MKKPHMTTEELRRIHQAQPFRPFVLNLASGRKIRVNHPEFMAYAKGARATVVYDETGGFEIIDLLLVDSIEVRSNPNRRRAG